MLQVCASDKDEWKLTGSKIRAILDKWIEDNLYDTQGKLESNGCLDQKQNDH